MFSEIFSNKKAELFFVVMLASLFLLVSFFAFMMHDTITGMASAEPLQDDISENDSAQNMTSGQNSLTTSDSTGDHGSGSGG